MREVHRTRDWSAEGGAGPLPGGCRYLLRSGLSRVAMREGKSRRAARSGLRDEHVAKIVEDSWPRRLPSRLLRGLQARWVSFNSYSYE